MSVAPGYHQCCVWDRYKYALYTRFREPKMYRLAAEGDWDLIPDRCKSHPKEAKFIHKYAPMDTPLGRLLRTNLGKESEEFKSNIFGMKHAAVAALLDADPSAATVRDTFQRTPLHWGCMDAPGNHSEDGAEHIADLCPNSSILVLLLERAPQAARMVDIEKRTPLHYLVARNDIIPTRLAAKLVALYPEALSMKDEVGETPLDILKSRADEVRNANDIIISMQKLHSMLTPNSSEMLP